MKRTKLSILLFVLLVSCSKGIEENNDLKKMNLKGNIKSVTLEQFKAEEFDGEIIKTELQNSNTTNYINTELVFNEIGMLIKKLEFNLSGKLQFKTIYEFDSINNVSKKLEYYSNNKLENVSTYKYSFNSSGEKIEEKEFLSGKLTEGNWNHSFFSESKKTKKIKYIDDEIFYKNEYFYNENGQEIMRNELNREGKLFFKTIYKYDVKGNILERTLFDFKGNLLSVNNYKYTEFDKNNNWIKSITSKDSIIDRVLERKIMYY